MPQKKLILAALGAASLLALAGCSGSAQPAATTGGADDGGKPTVVASTNVYGDIAAQIGGDLIDVQSIITSISQDPHEYEASAADQLTVSEADLIIQNGGGYDSFIESLIDSTGTKAPVITAVEFNHDWPGDGHDHDHAEGDEHTDAADEHTDAADDHAEGDDHEGHDHVEGFNEHVWYDPHTVEHVAEAISHELGELDPDNAKTYEANYETFAAGIGELETSLAKVATDHAGEKVFVTEPVPLHLTAAAGLENATPEAFSEAVEEGQDVPPATLLEALDIVKAGDVRIVIANAQTGGAETTQVIDTAKAGSIPVLEFTEIVPEGKTYLTWMTQNVTDISEALAQ